MKLGALLLALIVFTTSANAQTPPSATTHNQGPVTAAGVAARLQAQGYTGVENLHKGPDGKWVGNATRNGVAVSVTAEPDGGITAR
jgi:hypothetical protein